MKALQNIFLLCLCILGAYLMVAGCFERNIFIAFIGIVSGVALFSISAGILYDLNVAKV